MDKSGQRTCLPRGSVRQHTSTFAHVSLPFSESTCVLRFPLCLHPHFCSSLSGTSASDHVVAGLSLHGSRNKSFHIHHALSEPNLLVASGSVFLEVPC